MMEQFSQRNPAVRTMHDYMTLLTILRHYADRAQRLALDTDDLRTAQRHYAAKAMYERNIARITEALAKHSLWLADVIITEER